MSKGKKPKKPKESAPAGSGLWRPLVAVGLTLAAAVGALAALGWLGDEALRRIGPRDRYRVNFADVACEPPPGLDRPAFLAEVRYVGNLPETFNVLDPGDQERVSAAFAAHPWVAEVEKVEVGAGNAVRVGLRFRKPVLSVVVTGGTERLVDGGGVLLPVSPAPAGVAELANPVPAPKTAAGQKWADATVTRAVELVQAYHPTQVQKTPKGWRLTQPGGRVLVVD